MFDILRNIHIGFLAKGLDEADWSHPAAGCLSLAETLETEL